MERKREHTNPLPEPDLERHVSDNERGYGTPASGRTDADVSEPVPDVEHHPEPDAENIIPAKDRPGTL